MPVHRLTCRRPGQFHIHVRGYKEKGSINTPLELAIDNNVDRYSLAIRRLEHLSPVDGVVLGVGQLAIFFPGVGFIPVTIMLARLLGFERAHAARIAFLLALPAFAGEVLLSGSQLYREGALVPAGELVVSAVVSLIAALIAGGIVLAWLRRNSLLPFALYRLLASAGALLWWYFVFRG